MGSCSAPSLILRKRLSISRQMARNFKINRKNSRLNSN